MTTEIEKLHKLYSKVKRDRGEEFQQLLFKSRTLNKFCVYGVFAEDIPELFAQMGLDGYVAGQFILKSGPKDSFNYHGKTIYLPSTIASFINKKYEKENQRNSLKTASEV